MSKMYFEACKEVVSAIDVGELASLQLGDVSSGSSFEFRCLGKLTLARIGDLHVGVKTPLYNKYEAERRLIFDLAFVGLAVETVPELGHYMPRFMALAKIEGDDEPAGILTEDVSEGGQKLVRGRPASERVREMIYESYKELGPMDEVVSQADCDISLAFDVDGAEKLLDFTPKPIKVSVLRSVATYTEARREAIDVIPSLTITLPRSSTLGTALA